METAYVVYGNIENHNIIKLDEDIPIENGLVKIVIEKDIKRKKSRKELYGKWKGKITVPEDFNEPLDCFKEYSK
jgi:hypothetical protein